MSARHGHPDPASTRAEFAEAVTMTAGRLRTWLATEESRSVGDSDGDGGSTRAPDGPARRTIVLVWSRCSARTAPGTLQRADAARA